MIGIFESVKIGLQSLERNLFRSILTTLGVIVGVASTIVMVAIGKGARSEIVEQIASVGSNLIIVVPGSSQREGVYMGSGAVHTLTLADSEAIAKQCPSVKLIAAVYGQVAQIVSGNRNWRTRISGVSNSYFTLRGWKLSLGRTFSPSEGKNLSKVCVVGSKVREAILGDSSSVGSTIRIDNVPFRIIGMLENKGQSYSGEDQDDVVFVPFKTAQARLFGTPFLGEARIILAQVYEPSTTSMASKEINDLLSRRHKIRTGQDRDFTVRSLTESQQATQRSVEIMGLFLAVVAAISLVVGAIGIMNIMLVSVTERTREIGIRMAVGAKTNDILIQFIIEAICLALAGGIAGTAIGIAASYVFAYKSGILVVVGPQEIVGSLTVSACVGLVSGVFPAWKASRLNPIDALRIE